MESTAPTGERIVAGLAAGLLELGDELTFEGRHLGVRQRLSARIVEFDRPRYLRDEMTRGAFKSLVHHHRFELVDGGAATRMEDELTFSAPLGPLGWIAERLVLGRHLRVLLERRNEVVRRVAEGDGWERYLRIPRRVIGPDG